MLAPNFGGYGIGISSLELNEKSGELRLLHQTKTRNPGYLAISDDKQFLYTFEEVIQEKKPTLKAYKILADYSLELINKVAIDVSLPCHISYLHNQIFIACYGTGNVLKFDANTQGEILAQTHNFKHFGNSINLERQEAPHAHQVEIHPNKRAFFVPDLGIDKVKYYSIKENEIIADETRDIHIELGFGPRHIVFNKSGNLGYLVNELNGKIAILKEEKEVFKVVKYINSLPESFKNTPSASAIRIHPNQQFLYVANRTIDAITIFKIIDDDLVLVDYQFTNGKTLREFNISANGKWLIACLQDSDETVVYQINTNGKLAEKHRTSVVESGICLVFL